MHWLRAVLLFWNDMRKIENALVRVCSMADLRLTLLRVGIAGLYPASMDHSDFAALFQAALLATGPIPQKK